MILQVLGECTIKLLANKTQEMNRDDMKKRWGKNAPYSEHLAKKQKCLRKVVVLSERDITGI